MKIWSFIPLLRYEEGHPYSYNLAVAKACLHNNWEHAAFVPRSCLIETLPNTWEKSLAEDYFTDAGCQIIWRKPHEKALTLLKSIGPLCKAFKKIKKEKRNAALLLEQFFLGQILAFTLAVMITPPRAQVWLVHRYSILQMGFKAKIYRFLHQLLQWRLGKENLKLLADSELLARNQTRFFKKNVEVLPIPHTHVPMQLEIIKQDKILVWWPGGYTTVPKGLPIIQKLVASNREDFKLIVADSAQNFLSHATLPIQFIPSHLPRDEYMQWMRSVDLILLPYDPSVYHFATSGIFVEAVVCGKIPLVTDKTWMANELHKFGLQDLIMNWEDPLIFDHIARLAHDTKVKELLCKMQKQYKAFHSEEGFAKVMEKIVKNAV